MVLEGPNKNDIEAIFRRLKSVPTNKVCFDCNAKNPSWSSVTYGVFICLDCSAVHRGLGVHLSFVRSTQLDTNWTWIQLRQMQLGGNASANTFFRQHNACMTDAQQKYNSRAAQLYKEKLNQMANKAMQEYGTQLIIGHGSTEQSNDTTDDKEDFDFFQEHTIAPVSQSIGSIDEQETSNQSKEPQSGIKIQGAKLSSAAPNIDNAFSMSANKTKEKPHIIGSRIAQAKRTTSLGAKKGGFGAQKVKTNFADIERDAALADQIKFSAKEEEQKEVTESAEDEDEKVTSMKLAYKDLSVKQKNEELKLKQMDPKKAKQVERLGMGFGSKSGMSHSATSDMQTLGNTSPVKTTNISDIDRGEADDFFDCFVTALTGTGDLLMLDVGKSRKLRNDNEFLNDTGSKDTTKIVWDDLRNESQTKKPTTPIKSKQTKIQSRPTTIDTSGEAQRKFGSAKSISSAQYFGNTSTDERMNLGQFEGSTSISSADLFGHPSSSNDYSGIQTPDFDDVKESVRQGVTKVAGKLSSLANGVMTSIQEKYGGY